jgi:urate oxidase
MGVFLVHNQYGKAETRVVRVYRDADPHELVDYNVSVALSGEFTAVYLAGDNTNCLTTDAMKNTVNAFALEHGEAARQPESFALALGRHFARDVPAVQRARVAVQMYPWSRLASDGAPHPHAFKRDGSHVRTAIVTCEGDTDWVVSGVRDLIVLKTTDSEFHDFYTDRYTTLAGTTDRVLATSVTGQWWHAEPAADWTASFGAALATVTETFASHHSLSLQQTLFEMGTRLIQGQPGIGEARFSLPNKHHLVVDLSAFGLENPGEVFHADDRPYGLIEGAVRRDDGPDPGPAFDPGLGW